MKLHQMKKRLDLATKLRKSKKSCIRARASDLITAKKSRFYRWIEAAFEFFYSITLSK
jgi:hypothetical protein